MEITQSTPVLLEDGTYETKLMTVVVPDNFFPGPTLDTVSGTPTVTFTSSGAIGTAARVVFADCSAGAMTLTLPTAASFGAGREMRVYRTDTVMGNTLTLQAATNETIAGANTQILAPASAVSLGCSGTSWGIG